MTQIIVPDISRWQGTVNFDLLKRDVPAVIIKAGGGDGGLYKDGQFDRNKSEARRVGLPAWFYFYKGNQGARAEAEYFVSIVGDIQPGEALVLDDENEGKVNVAYAADFADRIKELTGRTIVVYSNQARFQGVDLAGIRNKNIGGWVAKYGVNDGTLAGGGAAPGVDGISVIAWQYTSRAVLAAITGNTVDMSVFYGDINAFKAYGGTNAVAAPTQPAPQPTAPGNGTYTVVARDTLSGIGAKLGISWQTIAVTNGIVAPYTIYPGQVLKVYGGTTGQTAAVAQASVGGYMVVKNDTLSGIGVKTGHNWQDIANLNGISAPYTIFPGQYLKLPGENKVAPAATSQANYTVVANDNLSTIGARLGKNWQDIARANNIPAPYTIYPGQVLIIP